MQPIRRSKGPSALYLSQYSRPVDEAISGIREETDSYNQYLKAGSKQNITIDKGSEK